MHHLLSQPGKIPALFPQVSFTQPTLQQVHHPVALLPATSNLLQRTTDGYFRRKKSPVGEKYLWNVCPDSILCIFVYRICRLISHWICRSSLCLGFCLFHVKRTMWLVSSVNRYWYTRWCLPDLKANFLVPRRVFQQYFHNK